MFAHRAKVIAGALFAAVTILTTVAAGMRAAAQCVGDCSGDSAVTIDELLTGINIALGTALPTQCPSFDTDHSQSVTVDELLTAIGNALNGCPPNTSGVLLEGPADMLAVDATVDMPPVGVDESQIENGIIMSRLDVRFAPGATVGQVNAALALVQGGIVSMTQGLPFVTIAVPRAPTVPALEQVAHTLSGALGILWAFVGGESAPQVLPSLPSAFRDNHLLPTRFPAAWNAKQLAVQDCEQRKVPVLVADNFTRFALPPNYIFAFFDQVPGFDLLPRDSSGNETHGYDVTTTLAALFDAQSPTGANPFTQCLDVMGIQVAGLTPSEESFRIVQNFPAERFILNYSLSFRGKCTSIFDFSGPTPIERCDEPSVAHVASAYFRAARAEEWKKRTSSLWDRFVATPAAGNFRADSREVTNPQGFAASIYPGLGIARYASILNIVTDADPFFGFIENAGLWMPSVTDPDLTASPAEVAALQAAIVTDHLDQVGRAENVVISGSTTAGTTFVDLIESGFSNVGADVLAVGEDIPTLGGSENGTSFSAPQVAGLAAYLWLLSGDLRNNHPASVTRRAILENTRTLPLAGSVIDAYAAILSLDAAELPTASSAPVRLAILDVNNDGVFDEGDVSAFVGLLADGNGNPIRDPATRDYSRFDLNGDGFTGGSRTESFDLDRLGSTQYGAANLAPDVTQETEGETKSFDEHQLTDLQILCYYAYSDLYTGNPDERRLRLAGLCATVVTVDPAAATVAAGGSSQFTARVHGIADQRVTWSVVAGSGTISAGGLFTAGQSLGTVTVRATSVADPNAFAEATVIIGSQQGHVTLHSHEDFPGVGSEDTMISATVTVSKTANEGVFGCQATGAGIFTADAPCAGSPPCTACTRPPEVTMGDIVGCSLSLIGNLQADLRFEVSGTATQTFCSQPTVTRSFSGSLPSGVLEGTPIFSNGSLTAVDFNRTAMNGGETTVTTGTIQFGP
jgi:subtilase family protein